MGNEEIHRRIERFYDMMHELNFDALSDIVTDDYVEEYPQSGERIRGLANARAIAENYPGLPTIKERSVRVEGNIAVIEMLLDYSGRPFHSLSIMELENGKVKRNRAYFGEPFEAPEWRAQWVERF